MKEHRPSQSNRSRGLHPCLPQTGRPLGRNDCHRHRQRAANCVDRSQAQTSWVTSLTPVARFFHRQTRLASLPTLQIGEDLHVAIETRRAAGEVAAHMGMRGFGRMFRHTLQFGIRRTVNPLWIRKRLFGPVTDSGPLSLTKQGSESDETMQAQVPEFQRPALEREVRLRASVRCHGMTALTTGVFALSLPWVSTAVTA